MSAIETTDISKKCPGLSDSVHFKSWATIFLVSALVAIILAIPVGIQGIPGSFSLWTPLDKAFCFTAPALFVGGIAALAIVNQVVRACQIREAKALQERNRQIDADLKMRSQRANQPKDDKEIEMHVMSGSGSHNTSSDSGSEASTTADSSQDSSQDV